MPRRSPISWPGGARIALVPTLAFETWPEDLGTPNSLNRSNRRPMPARARFNKDISVISDCQYGERWGVYRLLDLFAQEGITTTWFFNGLAAERNPEAVQEIVAAGHEVATETYVHDYSYMKSYAEEREDLRRTVAAIEQVAGSHPLGFLSPGIRPSENTPQILAEEGYLYWVDPQHEDLPYTLKVGEKELVVLHYLFYLNDSTTYGEGRTPRQLLEIWKDCFDYLYEEGATSPKMMLWGNHHFLSGRPYRAQVLREFIRYARGRPGVWFARAIDIARWWQENYRDQHVETWPNCLRLVEPPYVSKASVAPS